MKTLIHTRIYALLTQNESNPSELAHAYEEFIETMTEMVANFDNRDDILRRHLYTLMYQTENRMSYMQI